MKLPVSAVRATDRLDVVRVSAGPARRGEPMTGEVTARWEGAEAAGALTLIGKLPTAQQTLCGFAPGWGVRAYGGDPAAPPLFEAAFCYGCDEAWLWGPAVPEHLGRQQFDSGSPNAQYLLLRFREAAGMIGP
ncbi:MULTISPECIES: hypothetical protein [Streptomyces]|uniref:hypothetical protein n=1 Tax=Streptomyces TaxID=1883 RepID=UPI0004C80613|nr:MULTISPECIES: hypothetical protein [unclassified Streptomyces]KJY16702.1 hypothetical protein VR43_33130 [Streptomyces sp. NRRL S-104]